MTYLAVNAALRESSWPCVPFRRVARIRREPNADSGARLLALSAAAGIEPRPEGGGRQLPSSETITDYWLVCVNDLVFNPMWAIEGGVAVSEYDGAVSTAYRVYELSPEIYPRFAHYWFRSAAALDQYRLLVRGITTFDRSVTREDFDSMPMPVPSLAIQQSIAGFLDRETARIHKLIHQKLRLIELLGERQNSFIESVLWHKTADALALRRFITRVTQGWSPDAYNRPADDSEWGVLKAGCVKRMVFDANENKALPEDLPVRPELEIHEGDLLVNRASGSTDLVGNAAIADRVRPKLMLCDKLFRLETKQGVSPRFLMYSISSPTGRAFLEPRLTGNPGTAYNLAQDVLLEIPVPVMPHEERERMVPKLDEAHRLANRTSEALRSEIRLLHEHASALVAAAVTGSHPVGTGI